MFELTVFSFKIPLKSQHTPGPSLIKIGPTYVNCSGWIKRLGIICNGKIPMVGPPGWCQDGLLKFAIKTI